MSGRSGTGSVAAADEDSVGPGVEPLRVAQAGDVSPDVEAGLLGRVLSKVRVPQDAMRQPERMRMAADGQRLERSLVAVLCPDHEVWVHAPTLLTTSRGDR